MTRSFTSAIIGAAVAVQCLGEVPEPPNEPVEPPAVAFARAKPKIIEEATAPEVLMACRSMLPVRPVALNGSIILRNRRGIVQSEHDYRLVMRRRPDVSLMTIHLSPRGKTNVTASVTISRRAGKRPTIRLARAGSADAEVVDSPLERVLGTDVTWLDLTFDFLWWTNASYEAEREGESVHGQKCRVILVKPDAEIKGLSAVRLWVDKKTGCLMQAEQVDADGKPIRRLWGTRVKKFDGKWMVSVLEVETLGERHRTKITVDGLNELDE
ncbi:MAG: outer membrane lipoprotein-sorting protein [Kiritimatiellae bacterium]|nr:outer membrane lipoprotein-sorting protein [Kiritimatiellia bacterium]